MDAWFDVPIGDLVYRAERVHADDGVKASITLRDAQGGIVHTDRFNLDRALARSKFAAAAHLEGRDVAADLVRVREVLIERLEQVEAKPSVDNTEIDEDAAFAVLDTPDLLANMVDAIVALGYAGRRWIVELIVLVLISRLLARPMNLVLVGPPSVGKSFTIETVSRLFPPDAVISLNGMSERALAYIEDNLSHRMLFISEESALERDGIGASLLRTLISEQRIRYQTVESTSQGPRGRTIEKAGPTGFITTTTKQVEPELETRTLTLTLDDSESATRDVMATTAARFAGEQPSEPDLAAWHNAQRWLAAQANPEVIVPFASRLGNLLPATRVRMRRDITQLLTLIQTHALLYRRQRDRDPQGRIIAEQRDYAAIYLIAEHLFRPVVAEGLTPEVRALVMAVRAQMPAAGGAVVGYSTLSTHLALDKSSISRRVGQAIDQGWLINDEDRKGRPARLRPGDALPDEVKVLPDPDVLFAGG